MSAGLSGYYQGTGPTMGGIPSVGMDYQAFTWVPRVVPIKGDSKGYGRCPGLKGGLFFPPLLSPVFYAATTPVGAIQGENATQEGSKEGKHTPVTG